MTGGLVSGTEQALVTVAPPTQGTWRSDDYVNAFRLVDIVVIRFYEVSGTGII